MLTIAINSATRQTSVALLKGKKSIIEKSWNSKRDEAEKILPAIVTMLKKVKKRWEDVKEIMVITGPGPFTGLRVGVTIANTIAWTENLPLKTFTVFEYLHARVPTKLQEKTAILVKGGGEYIAFSVQNTKEKLLTPQTLSPVLKSSKSAYALGEMDQRQIQILKKNLKVAKNPVEFLKTKQLNSFGKTCAVLLKKKSGALIKKARLAKPKYLQKPHITQSKKPTYT